MRGLLSKPPDGEPTSRFKKIFDHDKNHMVDNYKARSKNRTIAIFFWQQPSERSKQNQNQNQNEKDDS